MIVQEKAKEKKPKESMKLKILDIFSSSKTQQECMRKLKDIDKKGKGGTKWGDPGYMSRDVFNGLITCCLGVPSGFAAAGATALGPVGIPIGLVGLYLSGQIFHINAKNYDKFHMLEYYKNKIERQKKILEAAKKTEKDHTKYPEYDKRIKEANSALHAIDKERRALLPKKERAKAASFDDLDDMDFDIDWGDDEDWTDIDDIEESTILESTNTKVKPVYIVLTYTCTNFAKIIKAYTKDDYTHASLSLDPSLEYMYSFNRQNRYNRNGGFTFEKLSDKVAYNPEIKLKLACIFINEDDYANLSWKIMNYNSNLDNSSYDSLNLLNIVFKKPTGDVYEYNMICSQFVDHILKFIDADITGMPSNLVTPGDLNKVKNPKVYVLYEGMARDYKPEETEKLVNKMIKKGVKTIKENTLYHSYIRPIFEAKKFFLEFDKEGNAIINKKMKLDYMEEYDKSKKLYKVYSSSGNVEAMAYEADKLWYINTLIQKKLKDSNNEEENERLYEERSKILGLFTLYIKTISELDDGYNFEVHYQNSPFSSASIKITGDTIKYMTYLIKSFLMTI